MEQHKEGCRYRQKCSALGIEITKLCDGRAVYEDGTGYTGCNIYKNYEFERLKLMMEKSGEKMPYFEIR